jgi:N-acetyl-anhydromuramyl-L-alanine amidase AmpD
MGQPKPPVTWYPADDSNYTAAWRGPGLIDYIVVHVTQGSWAGAINWFQDPASDVSAHYVIRSHDGKIAQCVSDRNIAWHAGNWTYNKRSIGIEHEGYIDDPGWFTEEMYRSSAKLAAFLVGRWGIPVNRNHILGHRQVPGSEHRDPGRWWAWDHYMRLIHRYVNN